MKKTKHRDCNYVTSKKFRKWIFQVRQRRRRRNLKTLFSLWKRINDFPSPLRRRSLKTQQSAIILDLSLRNTKPGKSRDYGDAIVYSKRFPSTLKQKASVFKFLHFEECFRKAPFWWRISVDGRPNRRNKAAFSDFSGVERTGSNWLLHWCLPLFLHWVVLTVFFDE